MGRWRDEGQGEGYRSVFAECTRRDTSVPVASISPAAPSEKEPAHGPGLSTDGILHRSRQAKTSLCSSLATSAAGTY